MQCPRCSAPNAFHGQVASLSSSLVRQDGVRTSAVRGKSCIICGHWIDDEITVVQPVIPSPDNPHAGKTHASCGKRARVAFAKNRGFVTEHINTLRDMRHGQFTWDECAEWAFKNGLIISGGALRDHYRAVDRES